MVEKTCYGRTKYLTDQQLAEALVESQQAGCPTEKVCNYFRMIAVHMLGSSKYRGYPKQMQDDLVSAALVKCIKNIHNFKLERAGTCFNYYTRCTEHAFFEVLGKHYKQLNIQRQLTLDYANQIEQLDPNAARLIRNSQLVLEKKEDDHEHD